MFFFALSKENFKLVDMTILTPKIVLKSKINSNRTNGYVGTVYIASGSNYSVATKLIFISKLSNSFSQTCKKFFKF